MGMHALQSLQIVGRPAETKQNKNVLTGQVLVPWKVQRFSRAWKLDGR